MPGIRFDYDFRALEDSSLPSFQLDRQVNKILGYDMEPVVILTEHNKSERLLVAALKDRKKAQGKDSTIDFVAALDDLVPEQQPEKQALLQTIQKTLNKVNADELDPDTRPRFTKLQRWVKAEPFARNDIPFSVRRQFEGIKPGEEGGFVLIFPRIKVSDGKAVGRFAKEVRNLVLPNGEHFSAAGEAMILADVLLMVEREGTPVLIGATLAVLLAMWLTLGSLRVALLCMLPTALSLLALVGMMVVLDLPFNYLNILLLPVLIGVTVDGGVHMTSRINDAHGKHFPPVFAETGRAIVGGLVTSGDGFSAMLFADHPGLNSIGRLAILGFAVNLIIMLLFFPAVLLWLQKKGWLNLDDTNSEAPAPSEVKP
jgi:predicted RND superfamily exporter protein